MLKLPTPKGKVADLVETEVRETGCDFPVGVMIELGPFAPATAGMMTSPAWETGILTTVMILSMTTRTNTGRDRLNQCHLSLHIMCTPFD